MAGEGDTGLECALEDVETRHGHMHLIQDYGGDLG